MNKIGKIGFLVLISLLGLMSKVHAQATLSADTIVMGDTTVLTVKGVENKAWEYDKSEFIEVLKEEPGAGLGDWSVYLTSYDPGVHFVKWSEQDSLPLVVLGVNIDPRSDVPKEIVDTAIEDIVDIEPDKENLASGNNTPWIWIAAGVVVAALLIWLLLRRKKTNEEETPAKIDTRTPEQRALQRLEELRMSQLWKSGKIKEYYTELTDILRVFIEESTGIHATEMTSEECILALTQSHNITLLKDIFTTADLVKFAKSEPLPHEHQRIYNNAVEFVKETWERLHPTPAAVEEKAEGIEKEVKNE